MSCRCSNGPTCITRGVGGFRRLISLGPRVFGIKEDLPPRICNPRFGLRRGPFLLKHLRRDSEFPYVFDPHPIYTCVYVCIYICIPCREHLAGAWFRSIPLLQMRRKSTFSFNFWVPRKRACSLFWYKASLISHVVKWSADCSPQSFFAAASFTMIRSLGLFLKRIRKKGGSLKWHLERKTPVPISSYAL